MVSMHSFPAPLLSLVRVSVGTMQFSEISIRNTLTSAVLCRNIKEPRSPKAELKNKLPNLLFSKFNFIWHYLIIPITMKVVTNNITLI